MTTKPPKKPLESIPTRKLAAGLKRELRQVLKEKKAAKGSDKSQKKGGLRPSQE